MGTVYFVNLDCDPESSTGIIIIIIVGLLKEKVGGTTRLDWIGGISVWWEKYYEFLREYAFFVI